MSIEDLGTLQRFPLLLSTVRGIGLLSVEPAEASKIKAFRGWKWQTWVVVVLSVLFMATRACSISWSVQRIFDNTRYRSYSSFSTIYAVTNALSFFSVVLWLVLYLTLFRFLFEHREHVHAVMRQAWADRIEALIRVERLATRAWLVFVLVFINVIAAQFAYLGRVVLSRPNTSAFETGVEITHSLLTAIFALISFVCFYLISVYFRAVEDSAKALKAAVTSRSLDTPPALFKAAIGLRALARPASRHWSSVMVFLVAVFAFEVAATVTSLYAVQLQLVPAHASAGVFVYQHISRNVLLFCFFGQTLRALAAYNLVLDRDVPHACVELKLFDGPQRLAVLKQLEVCSAHFTIAGIAVTSVRIKTVLFAILTSLVPVGIRALFGIR